MAILALLGFIWLLQITDATFSNNPGTISIHENNDAAETLFTFTATCTVTTTCSKTMSYQCSYRSCSLSSCSTTYRTCYNTHYYTCYPTYTCNNCQIVSGNNGDRFEVTSAWNFRKKACQNPGCGPTCSAANCNNAGDTYDIVIGCRRTGFAGDGYNTMSFKVSITQNAAPTFYWSNNNPISVTHTSSNVNDVVNRVIASDSDAHIDGDYIRYSLSSGVGSSYLLGNNLFRFDTSTGYVHVDNDLTMEFSYYYNMTVCVYDRRITDTTCDTLNITLHAYHETPTSSVDALSRDACYETPTCSDQTNNGIHDTHGDYTNLGLTPNTVYTQIFPQPSAHFPYFHTGWHQLNWAFTQNDFSNLNGGSPISIDQYTGEIYVTKNISIFPSYPYADFIMVVQVSNPSASCYETTCTFKTRVWYTNWPVEIRSLPNTSYLHEDRDAEWLIHSIVLYDPNYYYEENFTCVMDSVGSNTNVNMGSLFEVRQISGSSYAYDSWGIYKLACQYPGCGYKDDNFLCTNDKGCMNHNLTQEYYITVTCSDAYNTSATEVLTFRPIQNRAPYYTDLPKTITVDSNHVGHLDIVYSILYWDLENENLNYEYNFIEDSTSSATYYWAGTSTGNYYNNLGNISATVALWNETNSTFTIYICGHERRNEICDYLYIRLRDYCGPTPSCTGTSVTVTNEIAVNTELFDVSSLVDPPSNGGSYTGLSYAIAHSDNLFLVNEASGSVTLNSALPAVFPSKSYSVSAYVFDSAACGYAHCTNTIVVNAVNNPISIDNLPATVNVHEDTRAETSLITLGMSDSDTGDSVNCTITTIDPDESEPDHFFVKETFSGSEVFQIYTKKDPGFTASITQYLVTVEAADSHGSTATGTLTVKIDTNQAPTLTNLASPTTIALDPASQLIGDVIYTVSTSDTENDAIIFSCTVSNTLSPFECNSTNTVAYIRLRRALDIFDDNGQTFSIQVCISDAKHSNAACGTLQATFTSSKTRPVISNLPQSVSFAENTAIGTTLFDVDFTDPDAGETHTFMLMSVDPEDASSMFILNPSSGVITSAGSFNFENRNTYSLEFLVRDNTLEAEETKFLNIDITDVNEAPTLSADISYVNLTEDYQPGAGIQFYFDVTDPDIGDTHSFSITSGTHAGSFNIDANNGELTLITQWDIESGDPTSVNLVIAATDSGGLSATAAVIIDFADVNDNTPTVTASTATASIQIDDSTNIITNLLTLSCTDADVGDDGYCDFSILGPGTASEIFVMAISNKRAVGATAHLRLKSPYTSAYNGTFTFTIKVADGTGSDALFVGVPVMVTYTSTPPGPLTRPGTCVTCSTRGKALIGFVALEGVIITGIVAHLIWHFCCRNRKDSDKNEDLVTQLGAVTYSKGRSRRSKRSIDLPSTSKGTDSTHQQTSDTARQPNPGTAGQTTFGKTKLTKTGTNRPTGHGKRINVTSPSSVSIASGLYTRSSMGQRPERHDDTDSSLSLDSSDDEVKLPTRIYNSPARDIPNVVFQSHTYSKGSSTGLPKPVYR